MEKDRKNSVAKIRANNKYDNKAYFKTLVRFKKSDESVIRSAAGNSLNGFIVSAVMEKIKRDYPDGIPNTKPDPE